MATSSSPNYGILGGAVGGVNLTDKFISHIGTAVIRTAGIRINSNGTTQWLRTNQELELNPLTDWILPNGAASAAYDVRITNLVWATKDEGFIISPSGSDTYSLPINPAWDGDSDGDVDTWFNLGTSREWLFIDNNATASAGLQSATFDMQIRRGTTVLATAAMDWTVDSAGSGGGGCFMAGERFVMVDGSVKEVQNIKPGDVMAEGGMVYQSIIGNGNAEEWYSVNGIPVTGQHGIYKDGKWMRVANAGYLRISGAPEYFVVANENHRMLHESGQLFTDFQEVDYKATGWEDWAIENLNGVTNDADMRRMIDEIKSVNS